jgi:hypothetical protein
MKFTVFRDVNQDDEIQISAPLNARASIRPGVDSINGVSAAGEMPTAMNQPIRFGIGAFYRETTGTKCSAAFGPKPRTLRYRAAFRQHA